MGNTENETINENQLTQYLKEGITMDDLKNLKKAFISLDEDSDGLIEYDTKKITELRKYNIPSSDENQKVIINENQFMNIMIDNIINNRKNSEKNQQNMKVKLILFYAYIAFFVKIKTIKFIWTINKKFEL